MALPENAVGARRWKAYAAGMDWKKAGNKEWLCQIPPDARFTVAVSGLADGRWTWKITAKGADNAMASGIVPTVGAAKHASEQFLKKAHYL